MRTLTRFRLAPARSGRRPAASLLASAALVVVVALMAVALGGCGGGDAGCAELCARDQECVDPAIDVTACTTQCEAVSERDGDFRAAVGTRAECYEDATCAEIRSGECEGDGE